MLSTRQTAFARYGPFNYSSIYQCASLPFPVPRVACSTARQVGVGLESLRPTPTFLVPGLSSRGVVLALIQVDGRSAFHRNPDAPHLPCAPTEAHWAHLSACLDLDGTRSVKGAGLAQADSGLLSLPYEATRFAGSPRPRVHRVRRDDLWTSASLPRIPSAQVPSSRRNSLASRTCSLKATAMNRAASTEVTTQ